MTYQTSFFDNFVTLFHHVLSQNSLITTKSRSEKIMIKRGKPMYEEHLHFSRRGLKCHGDELGMMMLMPQLSYVTHHF